ncbi:hypothetical protein B0H10DRAFT_1968047 [Mycena sp. CBHHK59/15]|nr:hypothetical protein B0H10DRAFT_1968047 [Mycena sp. CBHHK59/15]
MSPLSAVVLPLLAVDLPQTCLVFQNRYVGASIHLHSSLEFMGYIPAYPQGIDKAGKAAKRQSPRVGFLQALGDQIEGRRLAQHTTGIRPKYFQEMLDGLGKLALPPWQILGQEQWPAHQHGKEIQPELQLSQLVDAGQVVQRPRIYGCAGVCWAHWLELSLTAGPTAWGYFCLPQQQKQPVYHTPDICFLRQLCPGAVLSNSPSTTNFFLNGRQAHDFGDGLICFLGIRQFLDGIGDMPVKLQVQSCSREVSLAYYASGGSAVVEWKTDPNHLTTCCHGARPQSGPNSFSQLTDWLLKPTLSLAISTSPGSEQGCLLSGKPLTAELISHQQTMNGRLDPNLGGRIQKIPCFHKHDYEIEQRQSRQRERLGQAETIWLGGKSDYAKTADENVMHGQNPKIRLSKTQ